VSGKKADHRDRVVPPMMEAGRWYCLEIMLDAGTPAAADSLADGVLDYWIDGVEYGPWPHLWFRTTPDLKLGILWMSLFHHEAHSVEGILLDDIVVSTERVGCGQQQTGIALLPVPRVTRIEIAPNPGHGLFVLSLPDGNPIDALIVTDLLGRRIAAAIPDVNTSSPRREVDLSSHPPGVYLVHAFQGDGRRYTGVIHRR
jgi:hypothetical protein